VAEIKKLTETLSVSQFLGPREIAGLKDRFRRIINNRPDGEEPGQPSSTEIEAAARAAGIEYIHIPVLASAIGDDDVTAFAKAIDCGGPTLAFCRTGTRSTMLWALSETGKCSPDDILGTAKRAGYDLNALRPRLETRAG
jgi:sulfide:quinone oxidoreductase